MSDEPPKPGESSDALRRYQRRGGSARKDEPRPGLWGRVREWVGSESRREEDEEIVRIQPSSSRTPFSASQSIDPGVPEPLQPEQPEQPQQREQPQPPEPGERRAPHRSTPERLAVELVLPGGQRLVLLVTAPQGRDGGLLQLQVEPAPANDPRTISALINAGRGGEEAEEAHDPRRLPLTEESRPHRTSAESATVDAAMLGGSPESEQPPTREADTSWSAEPDTHDMTAQDVSAGAARTAHDAEDAHRRAQPSAPHIPQRPAPPMDVPPRMRLPTGPHLPHPAEPSTTRRGEISSRDTGHMPPATDVELPPPQFRDAKPRDTLPMSGVPAEPSAAPTEAAEPRRRKLVPAASRGGAAAAMFRGDDPSHESEPPARPPAHPPAHPPAQTPPHPPAQKPQAPMATSQWEKPPPTAPQRPMHGERGGRTSPDRGAERAGQHGGEYPPPRIDAQRPSHREQAGGGAQDEQSWHERPTGDAPLFPPSDEQQGQAQSSSQQSSSPSNDPQEDKEYHRPALRSSQLPIVGIDFGTSYSSIALMRAGLEVIPDENGEILLPSVISFPNPGQTLIGWEARKRMGGEAQFTIVSPKRLLGRLYKDPQVAQLLGGLAFRTFAGTDKFVRFEAHGEIYSVTDICAMILGRLRERACRYLDAEVSKAVFAVPVGFGTLQRSALEVAARKAGLEPVGLVTEPSAAVLAHGFRSQRGMVAVYDFGGGTFDFSILEVSETAFQVLCAGGDSWLGGDDLDNAMASDLADRFWNETGVDLRNRAVEWQALLFACEQAKRILSEKSAAEVRVDNLLHTAKGSKGLRYKLLRKDVIKLFQPLVDKSIAIAEKVMSQAGISPRQVDAVVLTGGTSLIPTVREAASKFFGRKPIEGDPDLAVVRGASLRAAELKGEAVAETSMGGRTLKEVAGRTIGAGPKGCRVVTLFERDTPLPAEVFKAFYTQSDDQTEMVIGLYEESKSRIDESRTIGHLRYKGLSPAPAGQSRIDFTFYLDEDGILHVTAVVEGKEYTKSIRLE